MSKSYGYCFTWNNYPAEEWRPFLEDVFTRKGATYLIAGEEVAPTTGTPHIQGYIYFPTQRLESAIIKLQKASATHIAWAKAKGTAEQNKTYCTKEGKNILEKGELPKQGKRTDIIGLKRKILDGQDAADLFEEHTEDVLKYGRMINELSYQFLCRKRQALGYIKKNIIIHWGKSGKNKTRTAFEQIGNNLDVVLIGRTTTGFWWNRYHTQKVVILDDFRCDIPLNELLRITDGYPIDVQGHCCLKPLLAETIYLTSNTDPKTWYHNVDEDSREALFRRIDKIVWFPQEGEQRVIQLDRANNIVDYDINPPAMLIPHQD